MLSHAQPVPADLADRRPWHDAPTGVRRTAESARVRPLAGTPCGSPTLTWFALRATLIDLLRRSFFVVPDPWAQRGIVELPHGGFVRWEWLDGVGAPVLVQINPGHGGPAGLDAEQLIERLVMLGWNTPEHPSSFCWLEAPRPEMWLRRDQRQRFADAADRIILALTVVLDLAPGDIVLANRD